MLQQNIDRLEKHNQATRDILSPYLTSQQLGRYDEMSAQQLTWQRANLQRIRERLQRRPN